MGQRLPPLPVMLPRVLFTGLWVLALGSLTCFHALICIPRQGGVGYHQELSVYLGEGALGRFGTIVSSRSDPSASRFTVGSGIVPNDGLEGGAMVIVHDFINLSFHEFIHRSWLHSVDIPWLHPSSIASFIGHI